MQIPALDRTQPGLPMKQGRRGTLVHDYKRHGTTNLYAAFNVATGEVVGGVTRRYRTSEFRLFLAQIDRVTPPELALHLIVENSGTHTTEAVRDFLAAHPRFHLHFIPTSASWLNAVETWFGPLDRRALRRGVFTTVTELRHAICHFIETHNTQAAKSFRWTRVRPKPPRRRRSCLRSVAKRISPHGPLEPRMQALAARRA